jgi:hypothetical protein
LDEFKELGAKLFEVHNSFYSLERVFRNMLQDVILTQCYLAVDTLDECEAGEPGLFQLLDLVSEVAERCDKVKWLLSSRNIQDIAKAFEEKETRTRLSLELNSKTVTKAVEAYITYKTSSLFQDYERALRQRTTPRLQELLRSTKNEISNALVEKADGTFLWVSLVFQPLTVFRVKCCKRRLWLK